MAGADTPSYSPRAWISSPAGTPDMECSVPPKPPTPRDLLAEAAELRRRGDLGAAASAELDALRLARAAGAGGGA